MTVPLRLGHALQELAYVFDAYEHYVVAESLLRAEQSIVADFVAAGPGNFALDAALGYRYKCVLSISYVFLPPVEAVS